MYPRLSIICVKVFSWKRIEIFSCRSLRLRKFISSIALRIALKRYFALRIICWAFSWTSGHMYLLKISYSLAPISRILNDNFFTWSQNVRSATSRRCQKQYSVILQNSPQFMESGKVERMLIICWTTEHFWRVNRFDKAFVKLSCFSSKHRHRINRALIKTVHAHSTIP